MSEVEAVENELSDFHRDYVMRYMEHEQRKQERASAGFLKERASRWRS
jgi:ABC-type proline/glycine betaine transport system substrate-binding protein